MASLAPSPRHRRLAVSVGAAAALAVAIPASAPAQSDFGLRFATAAPASPTTAHLHIVYRRAGDRDAKPSPIEQIVIDAPAGTRFGGSTIPACHAGDAELRLLGRAACPAASRVGHGTLTAITGLGAPLDPVRTRLDVFRTSDGVVELVTQPETDVPLAVDRARIEGSTATFAPPATPGGPPDGRTAVREIDLTIGAADFVTTPPACPPGGRWTSQAAFTFADGSTHRPSATTPCDAQAAPPRTRLKATPRRVRAGERTRLRFRLRSAERRCVAGATVHLAGRTATTDRRGRATMTRRFTRAKRHRARAHPPGCARATTTIVVARRR